MRNQISVVFSGWMGGWESQRDSFRELPLCVATSHKVYDFFLWRVVGPLNYFVKCYLFLHPFKTAFISLALRQHLCISTNVYPL